MTSEQTEFDPQDNKTPPTQFVPDVPEMIAEFPFPETASPVQSARELDPLDIGDQKENSDSVHSFSEPFDAPESAEFTAVQYSAPATPEGYTPPQFESVDAVSDFGGDDLDALFAELSESAPGQSAEIAVWCPWLVNAATG